MTYQVLAYLDPGTGSFCLQLLMGGMFGGMLVAKRSWRKIKSALDRWPISLTLEVAAAVASVIGIAAAIGYVSLQKAPAKAKRTEKPLVLIGGSIAAACPTDSFPGMPWINKGVRYDRISQVQARIQPDAIDLHPKEIVLMIGMNNVLLDNDSPEQVAEEIITVARQINASGIPLDICHLLPVADDWNPPRQLTRQEINQRVARINDLLDQYAASHEGSIKTIAWPKLDRECYVVSLSNGPSDLLLNQKGYQVIVATVKKALDR